MYPGLGQLFLLTAPMTFCILALLLTFQKTICFRGGPSPSDRGHSLPKSVFLSVSSLRIGPVSYSQHLYSFA